LKAIAGFHPEALSLGEGIAGIEGIYWESGGCTPARSRGTALVRGLGGESP